MKRTHKFQTLANVADIVATAPNLTAAAERLGVDRSTVHRWLQNGKVPRPAGRPARTPAGGARQQQTPAGWARAIRRAYALTGTEQALLDLATRALVLARDETTRPEVRLAAMGRYQQLVRQLDLEQENERHGETQTATDTATRSWPRRVG